MPFDPRLVRSDEQAKTDGPAPRVEGLYVGDLPPHLAALAQQLESDAERLSRLYPLRASADSAGKVEPTTAGRRRMGILRHWTWRIAAAVLLAGGAWGTWQATLPMRQGGAPGIAAVQGGPIQGLTERPAAEPAVVETPRVQMTARPPASAPVRAAALHRPVVPTLLFHELTAAEQEAVIDLLEEHGVTSAGLSF
jgi:hypothetical protein